MTTSASCGRSFAIHDGFKPHASAIMTMDKRALQAISRIQKLNTRSSTESELVGVNDVVTMILWTKLFLEEQRYHMEKNIMYQKNQSTILFKTNGRKSAGKGSSALNMCYFFITDKIESGNGTVEYCPTKKMVRDLLTKPCQGRKIIGFCNIILGKKQW